MPEKVPLARAPLAEAPAFTWKPFGYLRAQYTSVWDDPDVAFIGHADGFSLQNARLGVRGELEELVGFEVSLDGAVDERDRVNLPNGRLRVGLRDAYLETRLSALPVPLLRSIPYLKLRAGRFEPWFDPDGIEPDTTRSFIDRALESHGVAATEGWETAGLPPGRSMGVAAYLRGLPWRAEGPAADADALSLVAELAAMNGAGEFASANDNNSLALSAAVRLIAPGRGWAQAAYRQNERTEGDLPFQQDERDRAFSLGAGGEFGPVHVAAGGILVLTSFPTTGGGSQRAWGAHGQAMYRGRAGESVFELGYRFAILDPSSLVVTDRLMEHTVGAVYALPERHLRFLLNATHAVEQEGRALRNTRAEAVLELVL